MKLFPLIIRFYSAKIGVNVRLLDLRSMPGETSEKIMNFIFSSMEVNELDLQQLTSFCADNAPMNFGGSDQGGKRQCVLLFSRAKNLSDSIRLPFLYFA